MKTPIFSTDSPRVAAENSLLDGRTGPPSARSTMFCRTHTKKDKTNRMSQMRQRDRSVKNERRPYESIEADHHIGMADRDDKRVVISDTRNLLPWNTYSCTSVIITSRKRRKKCRKYKHIPWPYWHERGMLRTRTIQVTAKETKCIWAAYHAKTHSKWWQKHR